MKNVFLNFEHSVQGVVCNRLVKHWYQAEQEKVHHPPSH